MADLHCLDILFSLWSEPLRRRSHFQGLVIVTQVFKAGFYNQSCQQVDAWVRQKTHGGVVTIAEEARGPSGSFDLLAQEFPDLFEQGQWFVGPLPDNLNGEPWYPPVETHRLMDAHGSFITPEYLQRWIDGLTP